MSAFDKEAWFAKYKPLGIALRVGQRVISSHDRCLGTVTKKYPWGGSTVILDNLGVSGGGAAAMGCNYKRVRDGRTCAGAASETMR